MKLITNTNRISESENALQFLNKSINILIVVNISLNNCIFSPSNTLIVKGLIY